MLQLVQNIYLNKYKYNKIAIIDFDVHHGNGTQDIFYNNKNVLFISTHQYPYYPGQAQNKKKVNLIIFVISHYLLEQTLRNI